MAVDPFSAKPHVWSRPDSWKTTLFDFDGGSNPLYVGAAPPGTPTDGDQWQIRKFTFSGDNLTGVSYANGDSDYAFVWDDRSTYTYS